MAGVVARGDVMDCLQANSISTFGGNPLATAGALANLNYVLEHDLQTNALKVGNQLKNGIHRLADEVPEIIEVRGRGLMIGVEFAKADGSPDAALTGEVMEAAKTEGLLIGKGGLFGNTLRIAPPMTLTEEEADEGLEKLTRAVNTARRS